MNQHEDNQDEMKNIVRIVIGVFLFLGSGTHSYWRSYMDTYYIKKLT